MRILVVDDNRDAADSLCVLLKLDGHSPLAVYDGLAAISAISAGEYEIVVLDIALPLIDGFTIASTIRNDSRNTTLILIAMTGMGRESDVEASISAGFDYHFTKPTPYSTVKALLDRIAAERDPG